MKRMIHTLMFAALIIPSTAFGQNGSASNDFGLPGSQRWQNGVVEMYNIGQDFVTTNVINYAIVDGDTVIDGHQAGIIRQINYERSTIAADRKTAVRLTPIPERICIFTLPGK